MKLPRGIWFEASRARYRVRKYRNGTSHLVYCKTLKEARIALKEIQEALKSEPKVRGQPRLSGVVPSATFTAMARAIQQKGEE
jgi:hypothetical protein